jgi:hypothetical protein
MSESRRKQKLYERGREALQKLTGLENVGYVCPICLNEFKQLRGLSEEHVPPRSIRGKVLCLTCQNCNSESGYKIDTHVHREQLSRSFMEHGQTRRAKLILYGEQLNVEVRKDEKGINIHILGEHNDPEAVKRSQSRPLGVGAELQLQDSVSYSRSKADVGYLKSAYLLAFAKLGYAYILRQELEKVRRKIRLPQSEELQTIRLHARNRDEIDRALILFRKPIHCLAVKMGKIIVCLPPPPPPLEVNGFYESLEERL